MAYYKVISNGKIAFLMEGSSARDCESTILLAQSRDHLKDLGFSFKIEATSQDEITDFHNLKNKESFQRLGLSESKAEIAANGRSDRKLVESLTIKDIMTGGQEDKPAPAEPFRTLNDFRKPAPINQHPEPGTIVKGINSIQDRREARTERIKNLKAGDIKNQETSVYEDFKRMGMTDKGAALAAVGRN